METGEKTETQRIESVAWQEIFPWLVLPRAVRIACDLRKLLLASIALLALSGGSWVFRQLPFAPDDADSTVIWPWEESFGYVGPGPLSDAGQLRTARIETLWHIGSNWQLTLRPVKHFLEPVQIIFQANASWPKLATAWTEFLWALIVWTVFGGAIARIAAVDFAGGPKVGLAEAVRFSTRRLLSYLGGPLLPLVAIGTLWVLCMAGGLVGSIPVAGPWIVSVFWFLAVALGGLMAVLLLVMAASWPLMLTAISVENSDAFDALSRSYDYVVSRPGYYLWLIGLTLLIGSVATFAASVLVNLAVYLTNWGISWSMGAEEVNVLFGTGFPANLGEARLNAEEVLTPSANPLAGFWLKAVSTGLTGFVYSYFWSAATVVYFLLRRAVDRDALNIVAPSDSSQPDAAQSIGIGQETPAENPPST